jgi:hypothetical protein
MKAIQPYRKDLEQKMTRYYNTLSEKERRRYGAIEAEKLGYGGISYLVRLFGCRPETIKRGLAELQCGFKIELLTYNQVDETTPLSVLTVNAVSSLCPYASNCLV